MKSVLYIDERCPLPSTSSGDNRALHILEALAGQAPTYVVDCQSPDVAAWGGDGVSATFSLGDLAGHVDMSDTLIWAARPSSWPIARWLRSDFPQARIVYDTVDIHRRRALGAFAVGEALTQSTTVGLLWEADAVKRADLCVAVSDEDAGALTTARSVHVVRNPFQLHAPLPSPTKAASVGFVGNFGHAPNEDGYLWFVNEVWPLVRDEIPAATFEVVGVGADQLSQPVEGVRLTGRVQDLEEVYRRNAVFVAPLRYGAGLKGKVAEAYEWGRPLVGTPTAFEGYPKGKWRLEAADPCGLASWLVRVMRDAELAEAAMSRGRKALSAFFRPGLAEEVLRACRAASPVT